MGSLVDGAVENHCLADLSYLTEQQNLSYFIAMEFV